MAATVNRLVINGGLFVAEIRFRGADNLIDALPSRLSIGVGHLQFAAQLSLAACANIGAGHDASAVYHNHRRSPVDAVKPVEGYSHWP